jgi:hypothetical protein
MVVLLSFRGVQLTAGQPQVDVVECRLACAGRRAANAGLLDRGDRLAGAAPMERNRDRRSDDERVSSGRSFAAQAVERVVGVVAGAEVEDLLAELGAQGPRRVEGDDLPFVHDREAVAEPLRFVEVVRRQKDGGGASLAQPVDDVEELGPDTRIEPYRRLVEEEDARARDEGTGDLESTALPAAVPGDRPVAGGDGERDPPHGADVARVRLGVSVTCDA